MQSTSWQSTGGSSKLIYLVAMDFMNHYLALNPLSLLPGEPSFHLE